jgi:hypothetical protein
MEQPPADTAPPPPAAVEAPASAIPGRPPRRVSPLVKLLSAMSVLAVCGTYLAAQIDFVRRHTLGFPALDVRRYWFLQIKFIWVRGLGAALLLAAAAFLLHRGRQAD